MSTLFDLPGAAPEPDRPQGPEVPLDDLLASLEKTIAELAEGSAPLQELVAAHQRASRLLADAQARLRELKGSGDRLAELLSE